MFEYEELLAEASYKKGGYFTELLTINNVCLHDHDITRQMEINYINSGSASFTELASNCSCTI